jgi:hypothetical protein
MKKRPNDFLGMADHPHCWSLQITVLRKFFPIAVSNSMKLNPMDQSPVIKRLVCRGRKLGSVGVAGRSPGSRIIPRQVVPERRAVRVVPIQIWLSPPSLTTMSSSRFMNLLTSAQMRIFQAGAALLL